MTILESIETNAVIQEKQQLLIKFLTKKFGLTEAERVFIKSVKEKSKLAKAEDELPVATSKEAVLALLH